MAVVDKKMIEADYHGTWEIFNEKAGFHSARSKFYSFFASIAGILLMIVFREVYGTDAAGLFTFTAIVWYIFGYKCRDHMGEAEIWRRDYREASEEFRAEHPELFGEDGGYIGWK